MRLALGPVGYHWNNDQLLAFYNDIAEAPVDIVYLGETVCSKRRSLGWMQWLEIGRMLKDRGKEIVLSTLTVVEAESELSQIERVCSNGEFLVEANDAAAVHMLMENGLPFVAGASLNVYNERTLAQLRDLGLFRWIPPLEISGAALATMIRMLGSDHLETELFTLGRMPLAYSARCFTARAHGYTRDHCHFICGRYPSGMAVETQEGQPFLTLNGLQTQSARIVNLLPYWREAAHAGVGILRISPDASNTPALLHRARVALDRGNIPEVADLIGAPECDGYWLEQAGIITSSAPCV